MNAKQFAALLVELNACSEAREWASGKSLAVVWKTCKRGDWLLWLCGKMADKPNWPTHKEVILAACGCNATIDEERAAAAAYAASASAAAAVAAVAATRSKTLAKCAVLVRKRLKVQGIR